MKRGSFQPILVVVGAVMAFSSLTACGEDEPVNYTSSHRQAFLDACSEPLDDPRLLSDICRCTWDRLESDMAFRDFEALNETLTIDPTAGLPEDVTEVVADCFISEADL